MNEFIYVDFLFRQGDAMRAADEIRNLGDDFRLLSSEADYELYNSDDMLIYFRISGEINSSAATMIKLNNKFLADHMRISYIPDKLKDKYRS